MLRLTSAFLSPQTLYTHIVTDIKNINAKHKNNKVNTVSTDSSRMCLCVNVAAWNFALLLCISDVTELHVHHAEGQ